VYVQAYSMLCIRDIHMIYSVCMVMYIYRCTQIENRDILRKSPENDKIQSIASMNINLKHCLVFCFPGQFVYMFLSNHNYLFLPI